MEKPKRKKRLEVLEPFKQGEYQEVIDRLDQYFKDSSKFILPCLTVLELKPMYLYSSLCLGQELNKEYELEVLYGYYDDNPEAEALYKAFRAKVLILKLKDEVDEAIGYWRGKNEFKERVNAFFEDFHFKSWISYKKVRAPLDDLWLMNHYLYKLLDEELKKVDSFMKESLQEFMQENIEELELDTSIPNKLVHLAGVYSRLDKYDLALEKLDNFHRTKDGTPDSLILAGICHQSLGQYKKAVFYFEKCSKIPDILNCFFIQGRYLQCLSQYLKFTKEPYSKYNYDSLIDSYNSNLIKKNKEAQMGLSVSDSLYKYYPLNEYTLDALSNQYFYLASKDQLNDPIELPYEHIEELQRYKIIRNNFKISSFSKNQNSMLMWSHYTGNHQGIMVEYQFKNLADWVGIGSVEYTSALERLENKENYYFNQYLLTKNKDWAYEKEVRLFGYKKDKVYYSADPEPDKIQASIQSITLGYKIDESENDLKKKLKGWILYKVNSEEKPSIILRKAALSENNPFVIEHKKLDLEKIDEKLKIKQ